MDAQIAGWLDRFALDDFVRRHVQDVLTSLPAEVLEDFLGDPNFNVYDFEPGPGVMMQVPVGMPGALGGAARSVVLKRTLRHRPVAFVRYIIAHELAHAHLRNAGRHDGEDPEHAADALAAAWGFPKSSWY